MTRSLLALLLGSTLLGCASLPFPAQADALDALQERVIKVSAGIGRSVVHIESAIRQNNRRNVVTGSGFLMDASGIVLTNEHVVERAEKVSVVIPGRTGRYPAEVVGTDKQTDLAVLRITLREGDKPFEIAKLGDSDALRVGEWVIAIGNPYGLDGTVSLGIVSAKKRDLEDDDLLNDFIQTDAMIDRGSSGGPLVNLKSEVVGINSRGQGRGIGFTIPINTAKRVTADLLGQGTIARGYLGVALQPLNRELATYWKIGEIEGVVVNGVTAQSPAALAGLEVGDILTKFDGKAVTAEKDEDLGDFQRLVAEAEVGKEVALQIYRKGQPQNLSIKLGVQPKVVPEEEETDYGFTVQEVTESLYRQYRLLERAGVLVSFVEQGTEAAEATMGPGDQITRIEGNEIPNIEAFREVMAKLPKDRPFLVEAKRGTDVRFLLIVPRGGSQPRAAVSEPPSEG